MKFVTAPVAIATVLASGLAFAQDPATPSSTLPDGAKFAYVDIARIAAESSEGQEANLRVQELSEQKLTEIETRNTQAQGDVTTLNQQLLEAQQKLQQGQNVISSEAALSLQREITRLQLDVQRTSQDAQADIDRMTQDAEGEVQDLQQRLQLEFEQQLLPAIDALAAEKGLSFIFNASQGLIWADPSLDLTEELIVLLNTQAAATP